MRLPYSALLFATLVPFTLLAQVEVEPNDIYTQANFWPENATITGTSCLAIGTPLDVDWYMVVPSDQGLITVTATVSNNTAGTYGISIQFYQQDGTTLHWNTGAPSTPTGLTSQTLHYCSGTDTLYVAVATALDHCEYYSLSYTVTPPAFANDAEGNDELASATPLAPSTWTEGRVDFAFDDIEDWYRIDPPQVGRYELTVEAVYQTDGTAAGSITTQLYVENGTLAANQGAQVGANSALTTVNTVSCLGTVPYYLLIAANSSVCGVAYRFKWELVPTVFSDDEAEPNNTAQQAGYFPPDSPQEGVPGDTDWWKLYKPYNGDLQLAVRAAFIDAGTGDFTVQVFNTALQLQYNGGITPGQNNAPSSLLITVPASAPDSFYVQIYNNSFDCGSYELSYASDYMGIEEEAYAHAISVMPNPSSDLFTFQLKGARISGIQVRDMEGRLVMDRKLGGLATFTWDANELRAGSYIARVSAVDGTTSTIRLVRTP